MTSEYCASTYPHHSHLWLRGDERSISDAPKCPGIVAVAFADRERVEISDPLWQQFGDCARAMIAVAHANRENLPFHRAAIAAADAISNVRRFDRTQS